MSTAALTDIGISTARNEITNMSSAKENLAQLINNLESRLKGSADYNNFSTGTIRGESIDTNLKEIIKIAKNSIDDTNRLIDATVAFLDRNEAENKKGV